MPCQPTAPPPWMCVKNCASGRYEVANNSYAKGIVLTIANDCIGTGPRLQLLTENSDLNNRVESAFNLWAKAVNLAEKLRTMRLAKTTDGEAFAILTANPEIDSPVLLDVQLVEADRVAAPLMNILPTGSDIDGIMLDAWGNPQTYNILHQHPGTPGSYSSWNNLYDLV
ncbi:MAG: phage portal protein, partial [Phycisphaerales bacterium]|nr:phage portal protein [Phycisphaerales bacterium]